MKKLLIFAVLAAAIISSCTENQRARKFGGTETIKLEPNEKFVNVSWKEADLWVVTQDTTTGTYYAREKSQFGVLQGKVIIQPYTTTKEQ